MDDDELIHRMARGDDAALRELFARHAPWLATRLRVTLPSGDVEDVLQETFLAAWRGAAEYRPQGTGAGWLWGIARRQAAMWLRRRGRSDDLMTALARLEPAFVQDPAEAVISRADLEQALRTLGPPDGPEHQVWRLLYVEDRPVAQVAALTGVPVGTVKSRAHRVRRLLRAALLRRPATEARFR